MILQCSNISKTFVAEPVISNVSFFVEDKEKVAIVGINGAGKSTLLKIITGELLPDSGTVSFSKGISVGYLAQHDAVTSENTIYEEVMSAKKEVEELYMQLKELELSMKDAQDEELSKIMEKYTNLNQKFEEMNGYALVSEVTGILKGLGFNEDDFKKQISQLSGGQKTRVALGKLLLTKPNLIMLDEPTNHLDIDSITFLENYLKAYNGAVLIVAHDRYFLDRIVTKVVELERNTCSVFKGNYSDYAVKKEAKRKEDLRLYLKQQADIAHQEAVIDKLKSFNREKSIKRAESREKALAKVERIDKPAELNASMRIKITPSIESGNDVLTIKGLSKSYNEHNLFSDIDMDIKRGERVALIGKNGTGKTTILKIINDLTKADSGTLSLGAKVHIGYYDQEHQILHPEKSLFDEISDEFRDLDNTKIRNTLAAFLFTGDDVFKLVKDLSGGERGRLSLAKLMLSKANFLILDEPTNHLDMVSKEILENALLSYEGTVLYVSHDRYFVNKTCTRVCELYDGKIISQSGSYDYFLEKRDNLISALFPVAEVRKQSESVHNSENDSRLEYAEQKAIKAKRKKLENEIASCEALIEKVEAKIAELEEALNDPLIATNSAKLNDISSSIQDKNDELMQLMDKWEQLSGEM